MLLVVILQSPLPAASTQQCGSHGHGKYPVTLTWETKNCRKWRFYENNYRDQTGFAVGHVHLYSSASGCRWRWMLAAAALQKSSQGAVVGFWGSSKHLDTRDKTHLLPIDLILLTAMGVCIPGVWVKRGSPIPSKYCGSTKHNASSHAHHPCCQSSQNI